MIKLDIDWSHLERIDDPEQKEFFEDVKRRIDAGEKINPNQLLQSVSGMFKSNPGEFEKLVKMNEELSKATTPLKNIRL
jgi:hypothetical protein